MPSATSATHSARIKLRTTPLVKAVIERAAVMTGATVSGFVVQNTYEAARRAVADEGSLVLTQQAFQAFVSACEMPAMPTETLQKLMVRR